MKVARYVGEGRVAIVDEREPELPEGGLIVQTEACGLCSGELMDWYMDRKIPHVLGHEVAGTVVQSDAPEFPVGSKVFPHHHAPCSDCDLCRRGQYVHCPQWKATKLLPGGMAERFAVSEANLNDTLRVDDLRPVDAALVEPLACVIKALQRTGKHGAGPRGQGRAAVIGLGVMGLMHMLLLQDEKPVGYEVSPRRLEWARGLGLDARTPVDSESAEVVYVCPGNQSALDLAMEIVAPGGVILLFAPFDPEETPNVPLNKLYFNDVSLVTSYSCGPSDTCQGRGCGQSLHQSRRVASSLRVHEAG
jgi:L-iditol 2-dehydrogenase